MEALTRLLTTPSGRVKLIEIVAVLGGTALAFAAFETDMISFGYCVYAGMVYMIWSCPDRRMSLLTAIVGGVAGFGTEWWGCGNMFWSWEPELKSVWMINGRRLGFPVEVVVAYAGAGWWMGSISKVVLEAEHSAVAQAAKKSGVGRSGPWGLHLIAPTKSALVVQVVASVILLLEPVWRQSTLLAVLGFTILVQIPDGGARMVTVLWGIIVGVSGFFFEIYATGGIRHDFAVWRYDHALTLSFRRFLPMGFVSTAPITALPAYVGVGSLVFGSAFLLTWTRGCDEIGTVTKEKQNK